jgi:hypothetical protein
VGYVRVVGDDPLKPMCLFGERYLVKRFSAVAAIFVLLCLAYTWPAMAGDKLTRYPGSNDLHSPSGLIVLSNRDFESGDPPHLLIGHSADGRSEVFRFPYARYVEVIWSPDGRFLLINDHAGSDSANCIVISIQEGGKKIDVSGMLRGGADRRINDNHHVFIQGVEWLGNDKILVTAHGYGEVDPGGFALSYIYEIGKGFPTQ